MGGKNKVGKRGPFINYMIQFVVMLGFSIQCLNKKGGSEWMALFLVERICVFHFSTTTQY